MIRTIVFSRKVIDDNRDFGQHDPPIKILPDNKLAHGVLVNKAGSRVVYNPDGQFGPHRAFVEIDCEDKDIIKQNVLPKPTWKAGVYYIYVQREPVRLRKSAPCITMKRGRHFRSEYAYAVHFPSKMVIAYTTDAPFLGNGARLWIQSEVEPKPEPQWYNDQYFRRCCGYKPH